MGTSENGGMIEIEGEDVEELRNEEEEMRRIPPWTKQITIRGIVASLMIGIIYSIIVMKLNLTTGLVPNLNVSAAFLAFVFVRTWTKILQKANVGAAPFTKQENTIIQTCAVACYSIAVGGGFGSYLLGLNKKTYEQVGVDTEGNSPGSYKEPGLDWMIGFLFVVSFVGLLALVPLRKIMIIDYNLPYPSGTATAVLINGFHTRKGDETAKEQVRGFMKFLSLSFMWSFVQWFSAGGEQCGFINFPKFGLEAWKQTFYFDFSMTYVGAGMICSHIVNLSLLFGAVLSWGVMWPLISEKKGDWFPQNLKESSMKSLNGYKVFISIALILGDGLYNFLKTLFITTKSMYTTFNVDQLKSGHLTLTSPRSMLISQGIGTAIGCIVAPFTFFIFYKAFDVGNPDGDYKAPYAIIYRNMAILGVEGFSALPHHCLQMCYGFFSFAILANLLRDVAPERFGKWVPLPMAMAVPFLVGAYFAIDMCVGSLVVFVWGKVDRRKANSMVPAVASGLICGDGLWILPSSILALAKINPPICMGFLPSR